MKINLHCHTNYSDGVDMLKMAEEHKKRGFSAFVVTDHVYPARLWNSVRQYRPRCLINYEQFQKQNEELKEISAILNMPCIQGFELALYHEEVLVFGEDVSKAIFDYMKNIDLRKQEKYSNTIIYKHKLNHDLIEILRRHKENSAYILCHPHLIGTPRWVLKPLYPLLDGFEFQNYGTYYFTDETNRNQKRRWDRTVPKQLEGKNRFYNSDAHYEQKVDVSEGNFYSRKIENLSDLIDYIKTPQNRLLINEKMISNGR